MQKTATIEVSGDPIAQPRPKVSTQGGFARAYTERGHAIHAYKQDIALTWKSAVGFSMSGPVAVDITFSIQKPKSVKRNLPSVKPDIDNFIKGVFDALKDLAWEDDGQVVEVSARKVYGRPRTVIGVREVVFSEPDNANA